jgi:hypothetical protein
MTTQERELLAFATRIERAPVDLVAVLADLSRIPHIQDPMFFGVLRKRLEHEARDLASQTFELSNYRICYVLDPDNAAKLDRALARISKLLIDHGKLPIQVRDFYLDKHARDFVDHCRVLMLELQEGTPDGAEHLDEEDENLERYLIIEENLHRADVSSLIREQPIYDFVDADHPKIVGYELSSSIQTLEALYGVPILKNAWLFSRVTELLDERMMNHLMHDLDMSRRRICMNLHVSSILGPAFRNFAQRTSFTWQQHLIVEIPFFEAVGSPEEFQEALDVLAFNHALAAIDDVPLSQLDRIPDMPDRVRFIKVRWSDDIAQVDNDGEIALLRQFERFGRERCVLTHCENQENVEVGLRLGFRVLQGHGVDADVAELRRQQMDRTIASMEIRESLFADEEEEPEGAVAQFFQKLFGSKKRKQDEDGDI